MTSSSFHIGRSASDKEFGRVRSPISYNDKEKYAITTKYSGVQLHNLFVVNTRKLSAPAAEVLGMGSREIQTSLCTLSQPLHSCPSLHACLPSSASPSPCMVLRAGSVVWEGVSECVHVRVCALPAGTNSPYYQLLEGDRR